MYNRDYLTDKTNSYSNESSQQVGGVALVNGIETFSMSNITSHP